MPNSNAFVQSLVFWQRFQEAAERSIAARMLYPATTSVIPREELKDADPH